jgi:DNA-binding CsgD family transcriptional regulator
LGISSESVKTARYRLRKKFELSREENLVDYIINLELQTDAYAS